MDDLLKLLRETAKWEQSRMRRIDRWLLMCIVTAVTQVHAADPPPPRAISGDLDARDALRVIGDKVFTYERGPRVSLNTWVENGGGLGSHVEREDGKVFAVFLTSNGFPFQMIKPRGSAILLPPPDAKWVESRTGGLSVYVATNVNGHDLFIKSDLGLDTTRKMTLRFSDAIDNMSLADIVYYEPWNKRYVSKSYTGNRGHLTLRWVDSGSPPFLSLGTDAAMIGRLEVWTSGRSSAAQSYGTCFSPIGHRLTESRDALIQYFEILAKVANDMESLSKDKDFQIAADRLRFLLPRSLTDATQDVVASIGAGMKALDDGRVDETLDIVRHVRDTLQAHDFDELQCSRWNKRLGDKVLVGDLTKYERLDSAELVWRQYGPLAYSQMTELAMRCISHDHASCELRCAAVEFLGARGLLPREFDTAMQHITSACGREGSRMSLEMGAAALRLLHHQASEQDGSQLLAAVTNEALDDSIRLLALETLACGDLLKGLSDQDYRIVLERLFSTFRARPALVRRITFCSGENDCGCELLANRLNEREGYDQVVPILFVLLRKCGPGEEILSNALRQGKARLEDMTMNKMERRALAELVLAHAGTPQEIEEFIAETFRTLPPGDWEIALDLIRRGDSALQWIHELDTFFMKANVMGQQIILTSLEASRGVSTKTQRKALDHIFLTAITSPRLAVQRHACDSLVRMRPSIMSRSERLALLKAALSRAPTGPRLESLIFAVESIAGPAFPYPKSREVKANDHLFGNMDWWEENGESYRRKVSEWITRHGASVDDDGAK